MPCHATTVLHCIQAVVLHLCWVARVPCPHKQARHADPTDTRTCTRQPVAGTQCRHTMAHIHTLPSQPNNTHMQANPF